MTKLRALNGCLDVPKIRDHDLFLLQLGDGGPPKVQETMQMLSNTCQITKNTFIKNEKRTLALMAIDARWTASYICSGISELTRMYTLGSCRGKPNGSKSSQGRMRLSGHSTAIAKC
jgi:hypothetical protein